jgi:Flp pilus assembly pilin Flp
MSDVILHSTARARVERHALVARLAAYGRRAVERAQREQTGQDMVEYAGVVLIVSIIVAAVALSPIGSTIANGLSNLVNDVLSGKSGQGQSG